jgi:hypothetical protein
MLFDSATTFDRCSGRDARSDLVADQLGEDVAVSERELGIREPIAVQPLAARAAGGVGRLRVE